jgi:hypothetical protein
MKRSLLLLLFVGLLLSLAGCASPTPQVIEKVVTAPQAPRPAAVFAGGAPAQSATAVESAANDTERMIIRTADVSMVVADTEPALKSITTLVSAAGGYVADSKTWRENDQLRARVSTRVPAERLDDTLEAIKKLAVRVERENIGGKDVTEEFSDLSAQLINLEATEKELRELLTEVRQKTQKAEDVLQVYQELTKVRGEIERIKGRMQFLSNQTALATANFDLIPDVLAKPVVEPGWRPLETLKNAGRALVNTLKGLVDVVIWLIVYLLPLLIVIAIPIVLLVLAIRWLMHRRRQSRSKPDAHPADKE